jgi:amidase
MEAAMELWQLDAVELARLVRLGQASGREAVTSCLARMDAVNPKLNAVVRRMDDEALAAADAADAARAKGAVLGPLHGVPVTIKVNTDQKGHPTDNGVVAFKDVIAPDDAPAVANLRKAGAIIIGRTNVPAFSMRGFSENPLHGRTQNPRDRNVTPGGSSGGAGAAVAAGFGPIGQGNDIAGSVRFPAYCCGVVGLRVGLGRIPSFNPSAKVARAIGGQLMATQGPLTRTVRDARLALSVMAKGDPRDTR